MNYYGEETMKVFVSWSGEQSQKFAGALKDWLEQCIQSVEVFFSSDDIEKGENWQLKISNELQDTNYGIVCLTPENINAPWIHFEAGALSKLLDSRVMVLAMNINFSDIKGPLKTFQATKFDKNDIFKLLKTINGFQDKPLAEEKLKNSFEAFWPQFEDKIEQIKVETVSESEDKKSSKVNVSGTVDEILQIVRSQNALINNPERLLPIDYLEFILKKAGVSDNADRIFDEVYSFTRSLLLGEIEIPWGNSANAFWDNYYNMLKRITANDMRWRRRFSRLFYEIRERIESENTQEDVSV